jgi:hypothetical protein
MMVFRITGVDSKTGADRSLVIRAENEDQALSIAKNNEIYPYRVEHDAAAERVENERHQSELAAEELKLRIESAIEGISQRIQRGRAVFLYDSIYIPVDSTILNESLVRVFDITYLRKLGIEGWEVVQSVPRTIGIVMKNISVGSTMGTTWGGGSGGNVAGVHLIIKKEILMEDLSPQPTDEVIRFVRRSII